MGVGKQEGVRSSGETASAASLVPGPPRKWRFDGSGRPAWIPSLPGARWATVFEWQIMVGNALRLELPVLGGAGWAAADRLEPADERSRVARRAAGLRDVWSYSHEYIACQLRVSARDGAGAGQAVGKRLAGQGRRLLHDEGVLPWAVFDDDGSLPKRWWREDTFLVSLGDWMIASSGGGAKDLALGAAGWPGRGAAAIGELVQLEWRVAQGVIRTVTRR
jgi:hypothetical protein